MRPRTRCYRLILGLLTLGLLAGAVLTASPAQAASGPGPYLCGTGVGPKASLSHHCQLSAVPGPDELEQRGGVG